MRSGIVVLIFVVSLGITTQTWVLYWLDHRTWRACLMTAKVGPLLANSESRCRTRHIIRAGLTINGLVMVMISTDMIIHYFPIWPLPIVACVPYSIWLYGSRRQIDELYMARQTLLTRRFDTIVARGQDIQNARPGDQ